MPNAGSPYDDTTSSLGAGPFGGNLGCLGCSLSLVFATKTWGVQHRVQDVKVVLMDHFNLIHTFLFVVSLLCIASLLYFALHCLMIHVENGWNLFMAAGPVDLTKQHFLAENPQWVIVNKSREILG
jgi:hypothetical protein